MPPTCPCIALSTCDELFVLSTELACAARKAKREQRGHLAAVTPDQLLQHLCLKAKPLEKLGPWTCYPTSMAVNLLRNLHMQNQTHSFVLGHHLQEVSCPPKPQGRAQARKDRYRDSTRGSNTLVEMICAHGPGREAWHSIFGSKSGASGHIITKGQGLAETSPSCWATHSTRAYRLVFSEQKVIARCKAITCSHVGACSFKKPSIRGFHTQLPWQREKLSYDQQSWGWCSLICPSYLGLQCRRDSKR